MLELYSQYKTERDFCEMDKRPLVSDQFQLPVSRSEQQVFSDIPRRFIPETKRLDAFYENLGRAVEISDTVWLERQSYLMSKLEREPLHESVLRRLKYWSSTNSNTPRLELAEKELLEKESSLGASLFTPTLDPGDSIAFFHQLSGHGHEWNYFQYHADQDEPYNTIRYVILALPAGGQAVRKIHKTLQGESAYVLDPSRPDHVEEIAELATAAQRYLEMIPPALYI